MKQIELKVHPDAQPIFQDVAIELGRRLHKEFPGTTISYRGKSDGSKDAVAIIAATVGLVAAARPIILSIVTAYLASRGCQVEVEADGAAGLKMKVSPAVPSKNPRKKSPGSKTKSK